MDDATLSEAFELLGEAASQIQAADLTNRLLPLFARPKAISPLPVPPEVFRLGSPPMLWIESFFNLLRDVTRDVIPAGPLRSLVVDGVISGVGGALLVPNQHVMDVVVLARVVRVHNGATGESEDDIDAFVFQHFPHDLCT